MKHNVLPALAVCAVLGACAQADQQLPFESAGQAVTRTVPAAGGTVSTAAGASVQFPSGALGAATSVTVTPVENPAAARPSGSPVGGAAFQLSPAGTQLAHPAVAELKFDRAQAGSRAWLASVVNVTPSGVRELGDTRVDLSTGVARVGVSTLGTLAVVVPDPSAVFQVRRASARPSASLVPAPSLAASAAVETDSVVTRCGDPSNRCTTLTVEASDNLVDRVENAAAVYPRIQGVLRVAGATATGRVEMSAAVRAQLGSGQTAENVTVVGLVEPTASTVVTETATAVVLSHVRFRISGTSETGVGRVQETVGTLTIPFSAASGSVTITREFEMRNAAGQLEPAWVRLVFPVQLFR
ncbi:MAG TPA: hypothetical protein VF263_10590 [Longimicrobiaceae bacterium]